MSTETSASEEKGDSTASTEEKAKTGAPVADVKEDSVAKLKEERDDLVVRLYPDSLFLICLLIVLCMRGWTRRAVYGMPKLI